MNRILFLDAEFVDNQELIELAVCNLAGDEVYHSYFRPAGIREWPVSMEIHHITPADVKRAPSFLSEKRRIQRLFDAAEYIVGFATKGDIGHLAQSGIKDLDKKKIIDIKDLFWYYHAKELDLDYYSVPGLAKVAAHLGVSFDDRGAHSAGGDTLATLECFHRLLSNIDGYDPANPTYSGFKDTYLGFQKHFREAKEEYDRRKAHGYILVHDLGNRLYKVTFKRRLPENTESLALYTEVNDINKAEVELDWRLSKRALQGRKTIYRLSRADLDFIRSYGNKFSPEEDHSLNRKLLQLTNRFK